MQYLKCQKNLTCNAIDTFINLLTLLDSRKLTCIPISWRARKRGHWDGEKHVIRVEDGSSSCSEVDWFDCVTRKSIFVVVISSFFLSDPPFNVGASSSCRLRGQEHPCHLPRYHRQEWHFPHWASHRIRNQDGTCLLLCVCTFSDLFYLFAWVWWTVVFSFLFFFFYWDFSVRDKLAINDVCAALLWILWLWDNWLYIFLKFDCST